MFTGTGTALVTPFRTDGSLDEQALRSLVQRQLDAGINFLVPCGTTGESPTLTHSEHLRVVELTLEIARGKVPVLAGAGGYNTAEVISLAIELQKLGADASSPSLPTTISPRRKASSSTSKPSPPPLTCPSSSTAFRAAPASTSNLRPSSASLKSRISWASRKPPATSPKWAQSSTSLVRISWFCPAT